MSISPEITHADTTSVFNELTQTYVTNSWLEIGYTVLNGNSWTTIQTAVNFVNPAVFISIPTSPSSLSNVWITRIKNPHFEPNGVYSFDAKLYQPQGNFCSTEWFEPYPTISSRVMWMVVEHGVYRFFEKKFIISQGEIAHPSPIRYDSENLYQIWYPSGCNFDPNYICNFPQSSRVGVISQIQSFIYDRYLLVRAYSVAKRFTRFYMTTHSLVNENDGIFVQEEILAYFAYESGVTGTCHEGVSFEGLVLSDVTSIPIHHNFTLTYDAAPGTFGFVSSMTGLDPVGVRVYRPSNKDVTIILQEDQCVNSDTAHTNPEIFSLFTIGDASNLNNGVSSSCYLVYNFTATPTPTELPTTLPTEEPSLLPTNIPTLSPSLLPSWNPTELPSFSPTEVPSLNPTSLPSNIPTFDPTSFPSTEPTALPSEFPSVSPTSLPSIAPTELPSTPPTEVPSLDPTFAPSSLPSLSPTTEPSSDPSSLPTTHPSVAPSFHPSHAPTDLPSLDPSVAPSLIPTSLPTLLPSLLPSSTPTSIPSTLPTICPTELPSFAPTSPPTSFPSTEPTTPPSEVPSASPTSLPSTPPTEVPSLDPTSAPSSLPSLSPTAVPSTSPSEFPSPSPTSVPSFPPTTAPSELPTVIPTAFPSPFPTLTPSSEPTVLPSEIPSPFPSELPSFAPSTAPSLLPSLTPTTEPSTSPSTSPTFALPAITPSSQPSTTPTSFPTAPPTSPPSNAPSLAPSAPPSESPTTEPSSFPTLDPTTSPTLLPTSFPSTEPTALPSEFPSVSPTSLPSIAPTEVPSTPPTEVPSLDPTFAPSSLPSNIPTFDPTSFPSTEPTALPSEVPSASPTSLPSIAPTELPSFSPTEIPSLDPTSAPSSLPSLSPTTEPSSDHSSLPSLDPSHAPTDLPSFAPSLIPTSLPTLLLPLLPTSTPTLISSIQFNPTPIPEGWALYDSLCSLKSSFPSLPWNCSLPKTMINITIICSEWSGISCDDNNQLIGLDLPRSLNSSNQNFPDILSSMTTLRYLNLSGNLLDGPLPPSFALLTSLEILDLSFNSFGMSEAALDHRSLLIDSVDELFTILTNLTSLKYLDIRANNLVGYLPSSLCQLQLETLKVRTLEDPSLLQNNFTCVAQCLFDNLSLNLVIEGDLLPVCEFFQNPPTSEPTAKVGAKDFQTDELSSSSLVIVLPIIIVLFICICIIIIVVGCRRQDPDAKSEPRLSFNWWTFDLEKWKGDEITIPKNFEETLEAGHSTYGEPYDYSDKDSIQSYQSEADKTINSFFAPPDVVIASSSDSDREDDEEEKAVSSKIISKKSSTDEKKTQRKSPSLKRFVPRLPSSQSSQGMQLEELHVIASRVSTPSIGPPSSPTISERSTSNSDHSPPSRRPSRTVLQPIRSNPEMIIHQRPSLQSVQLARSNSALPRPKPMLVGKGDVVDAEHSSEDEEYIITHVGSEDSDLDLKSWNREKRTGKTRGTKNSSSINIQEDENEGDKVAKDDELYTRLEITQDKKLEIQNHNDLQIHIQEEQEQEQQQQQQHYHQKELQEYQNNNIERENEEHP